MLFRQGPQPGPHLLMEFLRGNIPEKDLEASWQKTEAAHKRLPLDLKSLSWECSLCRASKPCQDYGVELILGKVRTDRYMTRILETGAWRSCSACNVARRSARASKANTTDIINCQVCKASLPPDAFDADELRVWR